MGGGALDNLDRRILFELSADSRQPYHQLSRKLHVSPQRIEYRVGQMIRKKVILGFITAIDYPRIGLSYHVLNVALKNITGAKKEQILKMILRDPAVSLALKGDGHWNVSVGFLAKSPAEAHLKMWRLSSRFEPHVDYDDRFLHFGAYHFPRIYFPTLQQTPWETEEWVSGGEERYELSGEEEKILSILSENARASTVEIARRVKISEPTVRQKIRQLRKESVIRGFTFNIDPNLTGHHFVRLYMRRNALRIGEGDRILAHLRATPQMFRVIRCLGKYDLICDLRVGDDDELRAITRTIADKFSREIVSMEAFRVYDIRRFNFFPRHDEMKKQP